MCFKLWIVYIGIYIFFCSVYFSEFCHFHDWWSFFGAEYIIGFRHFELDLSSPAFTFGSFLGGGFISFGINNFCTAL